MVHEFASRVSNCHAVDSFQGPPDRAQHSEVHVGPKPTGCSRTIDVAICSVPLFHRPVHTTTSAHHLVFVFLPADNQGEQVSQDFVRKTKHASPNSEKGVTK
jgi:hypothetical protein